MTHVIVGLLAGLGAYASLIGEVVWVSLRRPPAFYLIRNQMYTLGVTSLPVVAITGMATGMVLAAQAMFQLSDFGVRGATGLMVTKAMLVEMGPVMAAFMVTGRVGASMCAELGTMAVTEQIDALRSMAVNPIRYLVAPRFVAGLTMMPILTLFSCVMGIYGGYVVAVYYYKLPSADYLEPVREHIHNFDLLIGTVKAFVFGIAITTISCYKGITTRGGAAGVGRSTTKSVVICYCVILIFNFLLTVSLNASYDYLHEISGGWI
ncbi:MAG: ABC transporter permease [Chlamydiales bacterium]|nr:ABC transporter permease [Chlamydiales bacterium]